MTTQRIVRIRLLTSGATRSGSISQILAFTLIELLVVIAIMAILAALVLPVTSAVNRHKIRNRTKTEMQQLASAIQAYKDKRGVYPPDNPNNVMSQLYYELVGTTLTNGTYSTLDGNSTVLATALPTAFGANVSGFVNSDQGTGGSDEGMAAHNYLRDLKANQLTDTNGVKVLVGTVGWPPAYGPNMWHYVSTNPTNNPRTFDLWLDVIIGSKTNRIANWLAD